MDRRDFLRSLGALVPVAVFGLRPTEAKAKLQVIEPKPLPPKNFHVPAYPEDHIHTAFVYPDSAAVDDVNIEQQYLQPACLSLTRAFNNAVMTSTDEGDKLAALIKDHLGGGHIWLDADRLMRWQKHYDGLRQYHIFTIDILVYKKGLVKEDL